MGVPSVSDSGKGKELLLEIDSLVPESKGHLADISLSSNDSLSRSRRRWRLIKIMSKMNPRFSGESRKLLFYQALCALLTLILLGICLHQILTPVKSSSRTFVSPRVSAESVSSRASFKEPTATKLPDFSAFLFPFLSHDLVETSFNVNALAGDQKESERSTGAYKSPEPKGDQPPPSVSSKPENNFPSDYSTSTSSPSPSPDQEFVIDPFEPEIMISDVDFDAFDRSFGAISNLAFNILDKFNPFTFAIEDGNEDTIMEPDFNIRSSFGGEEEEEEKDDSFGGEETPKEIPLTPEQLAYVNIYQNIRRVFDF